MAHALFGRKAGDFFLRSPLLTAFFASHRSLKTLGRVKFLLARSKFERGPTIFALECLIRHWNTLEKKHSSYHIWRSFGRVSPDAGSAKHEDSKHEGAEYRYDHDKDEQFPSHSRRQVFNTIQSPTNMLEL